MLKKYQVFNLVFLKSTSRFRFLHDTITQGVQIYYI